MIVYMSFLVMVVAAGLISITQELTKSDEGGLCLMTGERSEFDRSLD